MSAHELGVEIRRDVEVKTYPFTDYFKGFERLEVVRRIFGDNASEVISKIRVEFSSHRGYMGVSDLNGHIIISADYLKNGDMVDIYLDLIHELVHVKQFLEGKRLFDSRFKYVESPTEIEAYSYAVEEARRLGLDDARICQYLKTEWMSEGELKKLARAVKVEYLPPSKRRF